MKKIKVTIFLLIGINAYIFSQDSISTDIFKPSGKAFAKIFTNFHSDFYEDDNSSAFEITRGYFGYKYDLSKNFSTKICLDIGNPEIGKYEQIAYLKNALLSYKANKLTVNFGLIGLYQFKTQETNWYHRYLYKSFQDAYKFGSSADLGISIKYDLINFISLDGAILNGEGYKELQSDNTYKGAFGLTVKPLKGLILRAYYDLMQKTETQSTIATFIAYSNKKFSVGIEYNMQNNHDIVKGQDYSGFSIYSSYQIKEKFGVFGRYDNLSSEKINGATDAWNIAKDGQFFIAGFEFAPVKGLKIAPNYQGRQPTKSEKSLVSSVYLNLEIKF